MDRKSRKKNKNGLERRDFLKVGATGVLASLAGCAPPASEDTALRARAPDQSPDTLQVPDIGNLVDPLAREDQAVGAEQHDTDAAPVGSLFKGQHHLASATAIWLSGTSWMPLWASAPIHCDNRSSVTG